LFPVALCMGLPLMLYVLVMEKEEKIKHLLETNGLIVYNYWVSFFIYNFIVLELVTAAFLLTGYLFIDISYFRNSSYLIAFWFLTIWNLSQISFALTLSTFISSSSSATILGYQTSIFLTLFLSTTSQFLYPYPSSLPLYFNVFPHSSFTRYFYLSLHHCIDLSCISSWSSLEGEVLGVFIWVHLGAVVWTVAGLLRSGLLAPLINLMRVKTLSAKTTNDDAMFDDMWLNEQSLHIEQKQEETQETHPAQWHESVSKYKSKVEGVSSGDIRYELIAKNINMRFKTDTRDFNALTDFSLAVEKGKILGLLGPNGAGKTTFLSIITGSLKPTSGQAFVCGRSISDTAPNAGLIGFCPQFDILWPELNVQEHLIFLGMFKGQSYSEAKRHAIILINDVDLEDDWNKLSVELSGGMKRRCSMAMSLVANPRIVFLDEPSTGLDPVKKRHFWKLIKKVTADKAVLLTTHLMEEAETLCQEIGIITHGKLRCIGSSVYLKSTFTEGLKLQLVMTHGSELHDETSERKLIKETKARIPDATFKSSFKGTIDFIIKGSAERLGMIFNEVTKFEKVGDIQDWSLSVGSLEDVFLNVVSRYREENV